jgi:hypothetical protein
MNIMIITERPDDVLTQVSRLQYEKNPNGQRFISVGFEGKAESALIPLFDLDRQQDMNQHVLVVADDINHLWQGMRQLLDIVIETWTLQRPIER